jgi:uncharacterized protein YbjT (DUF2867 family)
MAQHSDKTVLVTGSTGQQGGAVARHLLAKGFKVKALTRKPEGEKAQALSALGAEVVRGDFDDIASIKRAIDGTWGLFAVQNTWEAGVEQEEAQGKLIAKLAREVNVGHFVYASVESAHRNTGIPHFDNKGRVEAYVRELGFPSFTIVQPVFFMENLLSPGFLQGDKIVVAIKPSTALQMIAADDIGAFGALAFERAEELNGKTLGIAGDALTLPEATEVLSRELGRALTFVEAPIEAVRASSEDMAIMLEWFDRVGFGVDIPELVRKYGIKPKTLAEFARDQARK